MPTGRNHLDYPALERAVARQQTRVTAGIDDIEAYHSRQVHDDSHREVIGPLLPAGGASAVVVHRGETIATRGDSALPEMSFSVTKSLVWVPGLGMAYNDVRVLLLCLALTVLLSRPLPEVLHEAVLRPLGAPNS
jgi:CubicO group peptidase (beta-lactamase class C family)